MIAYIDASIVLRFVLAQPDRLPEWSAIKHAASSRLLEVECLRTLDRLRITGSIGDETLARSRALVYELLKSIDLVEITSPVLIRAAAPFPTALGTLDAIHLATALLWSRRLSGPATMATHDSALARAARACGMPTVGA